MNFYINIIFMNFYINIILLIIQKLFNKIYIFMKKNGHSIFSKNII